MAQTSPSPIPRSILAKTFKDPRSLDAFDGFQQQVAVVMPTTINHAQTTADGAQVAADNAQFTAGNALSIATALQGPSYVVLATSVVLNNEVVLQGGPGVTLPVTPGAVTITVNVPVALGYTPANLAGDTFTGDVKVVGEVECDTLRVDAAPSASTTASDHSIPINVNGTIMYMRLSASP